jgi:hypothetical protein
MINLRYFIPEGFSDSMSKADGSFLRRKITKIERAENGHSWITHDGHRYLIEMSYERLSRKLKIS